MRRAEEEPSGRRVDGRLLLPLVVTAATIVVLSTALAGPLRFTNPFATRQGPDIGLTPAAPPSQAPVRPSGAPVAPAIAGVVQTVLLVLVGIVAVVIAVLLIRVLVAAIRRRRRRPGGRRLAGVDAEAGPEVADAPTVLRGIAAALAALAEEREPGDAVVRAWLGLQQAAEDAGIARSPAETPTEFTGRVLSRTGTDRSALRTLLRLYLGARFGDRAVSAVDADAARDALLALEASWERVTA